MNKKITPGIAAMASLFILLVPTIIVTAVPNRLTALLFAVYSFLILWVLLQKKDLEGAL